MLSFRELRTFCRELPYTFWNTCPLCLCGLMPVFVVCFSALMRLDYATEVTDIGAELINECLEGLEGLEGLLLGLCITFGS